LSAAESAAPSSVSDRTRLGCLDVFAHARRDPRARWRLAGAIDEVLFDVFVASVDAAPFSFASLYLNSVAHYQHHFWRRFDPRGFSPAIAPPDCGPDDDPVREGYALFDRFIGRARARFGGDDTLLVIVTGLSQRPLADRDPHGGVHHHRLRDHHAFLRALDLRDVVAAPKMSRDWRVESDSPAALARAQARLAALTVSGAPLLSVGDLRGGAVFVETAIDRAVGPDERIRDGDRDLGPFDDWMVLSAIKSGGHDGRGLLWCSDPALGRRSVVPITDVHRLALAALGIDEDRL
jgi:hypothetical protein